MSSLTSTPGSLSLGGEGDGLPAQVEVSCCDLSVWSVVQICHSYGSNDVGSPHRLCTYALATVWQCSGKHDLHAARVAWARLRCAHTAQS